MPLFKRRKPAPGLRSIPPITDTVRLAEDINRAWLWLAGIGGALLVGTGIVLDLVLDVHNIVPSVCVDVGVGTMLFAFLFLLERRIVRRTTLRWVSELEEWASRFGQDSSKINAHLAGPVASVYAFIEAIRDETDYRLAWQLADPNWRLCRAQEWLSVNSAHPFVSPFDREEAARGLADLNSAHALWDAFAETELDALREWPPVGDRPYGAASATREVEDGQIVLLLDLSEYPDGAMVEAATPVEGVPVLVREIDANWHIANLVGDRLPVPGWPPNWNEGWKYWEPFADKFPALTRRQDEQG